MNGDDFRAIALALDGVAEMSHAKHPDFRANGRVFASLLSNEQRAGLKLLPDEQREFVRRYPAMFSPANGAWGRQGWTVVDLAAAKPAVVRSAVLLAYEQVSASPARRRPSRKTSPSRSVGRK